MNPVRTSVHIPALAWLALIALLAGVIGTELGWGSRLRAELPQPRLQKSMAAVLPLQADFDLLPMDPAYSEILSRPLFVPGRHSLLPQAASAASASAQHARRSKAAAAPPPPPKQEAKAAEEPPKERMRKGQFVLDGIIIAQGKNIALLREISTRKTVRAELGEEINGMRVEKLEPDRITFMQGEEREVLILKVKTGPKMPPKPASPAAQPASPAALPPAAPGGAAVAASAPAPAPVKVVPDGDPATPSFVERRRALRQRTPQ